MPMRRLHSNNMMNIQDIFANYSTETCQQWVQAACVVANALRTHDTPAVALYFDDAQRFGVALLGAWLAGKTVYLPPERTAVAIDWVAQYAGVWFSDVAGCPEPCLAWQDLDFSCNNMDCTHEISPDARLFLQTSGSSGAAKMVVKTCAQMWAEAQALRCRLPASWRGLTAYASVSPQHLYGLTFHVFTAWAMGWAQGVRALTPETLLAATTQSGVWISSPALLRALGAGSHHVNLAHVRGIISAGGVLSEETVNLVQQYTGVLPLDIYGSSETGVVASRQGEMAWQCLPSVVVHCDDDGLHVQSDWTEGVQTLSERAEIDSAGCLHLYGRSDRIIKLADKRVSLPQIEQQLQQHTWVADAHCLPHPQTGRVAVWVALNDAGIVAWRNSGRAAVIADLTQHLRQFHAAFALPRHWRFTTALPRNAQSKIRLADAQAACTTPIVAPEWACTIINEHEARYTAVVPLDLRCFAGHFAEFPLVPGVVQLQWVCDLMRQHTWGQGILLGAENVKYQNFIRPNDVIELHLRWDATKNKLYFALTQENGTPCASGRFVQAACNE